jgi:hypothetical protein
MRFKQVGNKREIFAGVFQNGEATASIQLGQPVCMYFTGGAGSGDTDGLTVVLPSTAHTQNANNEFQCLYGVCITNAVNGVAVNGFGEAQVFGFCADIAFTSATRASSTNSWSSIASIAAWLPLIPETVGNGWTTYNSNQYLTVSTGTTGVGPVFPQFQVLLLPYSVSTGSTGIYSIAASASATSDTRTALLTLCKGYIRIL